MIDTVADPQPGPTIAVQLLGGLGNQMFQAAAGLALARRQNGRLVFDISRFRERGLRAYALQPFALPVEIMPAGRGIPDLLRKAMHRLKGERHRPSWWNGPIYQEATFAFDPRLDALSGDVLIGGYFQSPRYFAAIENEIADVFAPDRLAPGIDSGLAAKLSGDDSVAIHLRRGDFASDARARAVHGVLGWDYYDRAVAHVLEHCPQARLFVFSDNAQAAAEGASRWPDAVPMAGKSAGEDFCLMSRARHHIIANSSFSWWSAWLDRRAGGIRVAPEQWFTPEALRTRPIHDLIPANWVRL